jgi:hypothetical protein
MKALRLIIHNIGILGDVNIEINKDELAFFGDIMQGKTTILNAIRWVFGGAFPADILKHGTEEAFVQYEGKENDGTLFTIRREWYVGEDKTTKARALIYTRGGLPVKKPFDAVQKHLNPFLLDQDHLRNMNALERSKYLVELFGVDTKAEDVGIATAGETARQLRQKIASYGILDLTPVVPVDVAGIRQQLTDIQAENERIAQAKRDAQAKVAAANRERELADKAALAAQADLDADTQRCDRLDAQIAELQKQLSAARNSAHSRLLHVQLVVGTTVPEAAKAQDLATAAAIVAEAVQPEDTAPALAQLEAAGRVNAKAEAYQKALVQKAARDQDEASLRAQEKTVSDLRAQKIEKLKGIGAATGIEGLVFTEDGFTFEGAAHDMISDSQMIRLSNALSAKYPEGFGINLIDRGESLGKSVLNLWEDAQKRGATVLVTVVGDKPAVIPENVGAYVVENGKVT